MTTITEAHVEAAARAMAYAVWPLATEAERQGWMQERWADYMTMARAALTAAAQVGEGRVETVDALRAMGLLDQAEAKITAFAQALAETRNELFDLRNRAGCGPDQEGPDVWQRLAEAQAENTRLRAAVDPNQVYQRYAPVHRM